jgi:ABC-type uncharacterized transport system auxiliary subunit
MLTQETRAWLSESRLFKWVLEPGSLTDPTHVLEGSIIALYGDFTDEASPKARMRIRFFVIGLSDKSVVFGKTYEAESNAGTRTAEGVIAAFEKCLEIILSDLETDLDVALPSAPMHRID